MFSSYTTSYVLTCISYVLAYNIANNIVCDIIYDIVRDVHLIGFGAGFRGFKLHARLRRHGSLHGHAFRHRQPQQRRQGQAAPGRHHSRSGQQRPAASGPWADSSSSKRRQCCFEENVLAWTEGTLDQCSACACTRRSTCAHVERRHARAHAGAHACRAVAVRAGEGCILVMQSFTGAGKSIVSCTTG